VSLLVAKNLWRFYGRTPAVRGLDLEVDRGSAYGFIGPNGAGKSTTLRMLATLDRPDAGRVFLDGKDVQHDPEGARRRIGFMPDPFALYDEMTVEGMLAYFANAYGIAPGAQRARVERAIELARIGERRREACGALSKGWRQRVLLAKTLVHDPDLLLLDEPASGLDPAARIEFREIVKTLRELGKAIIVSSHILTELAGFCDSVGIVEKGRLLVGGRIDEIHARLEAHEVLEVEVPSAGGDDAARARAVLAGLHGVRAVTPAPAAQQEGVTTFVVEVTGRTGPADRAALLRSLVAAGVEVSGLAVRRQGLEDLFMRVAGQKEDQARLSALRELLAEPARRERTA
jgi:ABC-2 type transport system ATP-binding protein